jgi:DNA-binding XRE family transcriptional regulator
VPRVREIHSEVGNFRRLQRVAKGWRQDDLAKEAGLSVQTIGAIEAGGDAKTSTLVAIVGALGNCSFDEYALGRQTTPPAPAPAPAPMAAAGGR